VTLLLQGTGWFWALQREPNADEKLSAGSQRDTMSVEVRYQWLLRRTSQHPPCSSGRCPALPFAKLPASFSEHCKSPQRGTHSLAVAGPQPGHGCVEAREKQPVAFTVVLPYFQVLLQRWQMEQEAERVPGGKVRNKMQP